MLAHPLLLVATLSMSAQDVARPQERPVEAKPLVVRCIDSDGKPVASAEVFVFQLVRSAQGRAFVPSGPYTSGDDGVAQTVAPAEFERGRYDRLVYCRVPGRLVGGARSLRWDRGKPVSHEIEVRLVPSRSIHGTVRLRDGSPAVEARVRVLSVHLLDAEGQIGATLPRVASAMPGLDHSLPERFDAAVAGDGSFALHDIPATTIVLALVAEAPGRATAHFSNALLPGRTLPKQIDLTLAPQSVFAGLVRTPDDQPAAGAKVTVRVTSAPETRLPSVAHTDELGRFEVAHLPAADYSVEITAASGVFRPEKLTLAEGERLVDRRFQLESPIELAGEVVSDDGMPVAEAMILAITPEAAPLGSGSTDRRGRFRLLLPRGPAHLYFGSVPPGFLSPDPQIVEKLELRAQDPQLQKLRFTLHQR